MAKSTRSKQLSPAAIKAAADRAEARLSKSTPTAKTAGIKDGKPSAITPIEYGGLQQAYDFFNSELFDGALPNVFITYQRHAHTRGYFSADRFVMREGDSRHSEIALNPDTFIDRTDEQICSTLVHEMVHLKQQLYGTPSSRRYHNKEWAGMMKAIGLQPSSTGAVGGKETGQQVSHYILPGGAFSHSFARLAAIGWRLNSQSAPHGNPTSGRNSKTKYTCASCGLNVWGKPDIRVSCMDCQRQMTCESAVQSYDQQQAA